MSSFLTRIILHNRNRAVLYLLRSPERIHGLVSRGFYDNQGRILWRTEQHDDTTYVYVVSNTNPDYDFIQVEYDATATVNTTVYDGFLNALDTTSKYRFVFTANPIINKKKTPDQKRGNRVPLIGKSAREWVIRKLGESGFENIVLDDIHDEKVLIFKKNGTHTVKIRQQTYSGIVTIVNVDQVRNALLNGLGSEKAYGCGMVTLIPVR